MAPPASVPTSYYYRWREAERQRQEAELLARTAEATAKQVPACAALGAGGLQTYGTVYVWERRGCVAVCMHAVRQTHVAVWSVASLCWLGAAGAAPSPRGNVCLRGVEEEGRHGAVRGHTSRSSPLPHPFAVACHPSRCPLTTHLPEHPKTCPCPCPCGSAPAHARVALPPPLPPAGQVGPGHRGAGAAAYGRGTAWPGAAAGTGTAGQGWEGGGRPEAAACRVWGGGACGGSYLGAIALCHWGMVRRLSIGRR